jgi:hypothetical protein
MIKAGILLLKPGYDADGYPRFSFRNPVSLLNQIDDRDNINRYLNNLTAT